MRLFIHVGLFKGDSEEVNEWFHIISEDSKALKMPDD
jgi:hypothetical protein